MVENNSITPVEAIIQLEKLIGVTRQVDFAEQHFSLDVVERIHQDILITYAEEALNQIKVQLGYLPRREVTLPDEPAIRQLLHDYFYIHSDIDVLFDSCNPILDEIYKRDMEPHKIDTYPKEIYRLYNTLFNEYAPAARLKVTQLMGHEPELKNSAFAELLMRCRMAQLGFSVWEGRIDADYEAEAIIWFREHKTS